jgi:endonuclease/exonuclease/phosphatase family metal-dependent hydrolase
MPADSAPQASPEMPADSAPQASLEFHHLCWALVRIVSVNAWGGVLFASLAAWLPDSEADVVCLQEVTRTPGVQGWARYEDGERTLPQRADLFDDVRGLLPRHQALFLTSDTGPVWDEQGECHRQHFGVATFISDELPVIGVHSTFVHGSFSDHTEWPVDDRPRAAQAVRLVHPSGGFVTVVSLHGVRDRHGKGDTPARRAQARRLAAFVTASREAGDLTVVCGDFNVLPDSETFTVLADIGLVDLVGDSDTRTSHYAKPVRHASYLLVSDPGAVAKFEILPVEVSDHRVLQLDLA